MKIWAPVLAVITEAWLVDLNGVAIDPENFIFNPLCKNRIKPRAQACVSAVLSDFNGENEEILDNILNCPCMERCFNGAPCRTKGDYIDFSKRNTHEGRDMRKFSKLLSFKNSHKYFGLTETF